MEYITLHNGEKTRVDLELYDFLNRRKWCLDKDGYVWGSHSQRMQRVIMNAPKGFVVDHINGNKLDNRKSNLRICTVKNNLQNKSISKSKKSSVYKGVYKNGKGWIAQIRHKHLGFFQSEKEAAMVYDENAKKLFGEFSKLNFNI